MAFFGAVSVNILAPAEETTSSEGRPVIQFKGLNLASQPGVPVVCMVDKETENATFLKQLSDKTKDGSTVRVLVTGILQPVAAEKNKATKEIDRISKIIMYVGGARRLRADIKVDPEQCSVFGSGFVFPQTEFGSDERKAELMVGDGTERVDEEGARCSMLNVVGSTKTGTDQICLTAEKGQEVYFTGSLYRTAGVYENTAFDKLKVDLGFIQDTDRIRKSGGGRKPKAQSMRSQLDDSFEEKGSTESSMSADDLAAQASVALSDF
jgi:hypothetical protein